MSSAEIACGAGEGTRDPGAGAGGSSARNGALSNGSRLTATELWRSVRWMINLRWLAVIGICIALLAARWVDWVPDLGPAFAVVAGLALYNLALLLWVRNPPPAATSRRWVRSLVLQLHVDLIALALLVRLTGGIANPFGLFCVFPVAVGAILLPPWAALLTGNSAFLINAGLIVCEITAKPPHWPLSAAASNREELLHQPVYAAAFLAATAMTLFGVVYFVQSVVRRQRHAEERRRQHTRIARSRERLARVGQISAGVAHSIRNPLHGVLNCLDLMKDGSDPSDHEEHLELMAEGLDRIEKVTSRLLALTRDAPLVPQTVDLNEQVTDTLRLVEIRLHKEDVDLRTELSTVPKARLDPVRFHEALFNVLDNAVAAVTGTPERQIRVKTTSITEPFAGACLEVIDSGQGVDQAVMGQVFDPFFSTKAVGEGSGLGLAIAREVIEAHGGVIQFLSKPGSGTTVRILLPSGHDSGLAEQGDG